MNQTAATLSSAGLGVFPCYGIDSPNAKAPAVAKGQDWRDVARLDPNSLTWPSPIVGVPIPQGVVVLDLDTYKGITCEQIEAATGGPIPWQAAHIQTTANGGQHYAFRAPVWPCKNAPNLKNNITGDKLAGLDSRAAGKGYIATGAPHYAPTYLGGPVIMAYPDALPPLPEHLRPWLEVAETTSAERIEVTSDEATTIREALTHIDPSCGRDDWVNVGLALKSGFGDEPEGLTLFDEWSSGALWAGDEPSNYVPEHMDHQWSSFKAEGGRTIATVYYQAIENGWKPPARLDLGAIFGANAADGATFSAVVDSIQQHGGDPKQTQDLIDMIKALPCSDMQRAMLNATLSRELKEADLLTKDVRTMLSGGQSAPAKANAPVDVKGQIIPVDVPLHPGNWAAFHTVGKDEKPKGTSENFDIMLAKYGIDISFNEIRKELSITVPGVTFGGALQDEAALSQIESIAELNSYPASRVKSGIMHAAHKHAVNPVRQWLESAPWCGAVDHVGHLFGQMVLAPDEDVAMCERLFRTWMRSAVRAGVGEHPGCEPVLVLVDERGGVGKTRFFRTLCPPDFRKDSLELDVRNKDSVKAAISYWLVELGELDSTFNRSEANALKAFLSSEQDEIRLPYGRTAMKYPRMTAFIGSVNEAEFLVDTTGNRRFWPMKVEAINHEHNVNVQQAWAQALAEARGGLPMWIDARELAERNAAFMATSTIDDLLSERLNDATGPCDTHITITSLLKRCGMFNPSKRDLNDGAKWMRIHGYEARKRSGVRGYMVPDLNIAAQAFKPGLEVVK
ncbi:bifunctional DNA primase/polymerase [Vibrio phage 1.009.O._10N.261.51.C9]|nr:bifunctional DNA primase/polymerase [Vibrio phage 1.009.O._10N.261.51.C9]